MRLTKELKLSVIKILKLKTLVAAASKVVRAYQQEWLNENKPLDDEGRVITKPAHAFLMLQSDADLYYAHCDQKAKENGWVLEKGYCPLLVAENNERKELRKMLQAAKYITNLDAEAFYTKPDHWKKAEAYIIGFATTHPTWNRKRK